MNRAFRGMFALLLILAAQAAFGKGASNEVMVQSGRGVHRLPYRVWKPQGYGMKENWPLIIFLHGMGERGWNFEDLSKHGLPKWLEQGHQLGAVVLAPQCPPTRVWDPEDIDALLDEALQKYGVDPERVILTGFSMGGYGTFDYAARYGWRLAGIVPVAGGMGQHYFPGMQGLASWIFCGSKDTAVDPLQSREALRRMRESGMEPRFTEIPDADHVGSARIAYEQTPELYKWMLAQRRSPEALRRHEAESMGFEGADKLLLVPGKALEVTFVVRNLSSDKRRYAFSWIRAGRGWKLDLAQSMCNLNPGEEIRLKGTVSSLPKATSRDLLPLPLLLTEVDGRVKVETLLQIGLDNSGTLLKAKRATSGATAAPTAAAFYDVRTWAARGPRTEVGAVWDAANLKLSVRCLGESRPLPALKFSGRDEDLWLDDSVEFFIQPDRQLEDYAHVIVNPAGAVYDAWVYDRSWDAKAQAKAKRIEGGWELEWTIPFSSLKLEPKPGMRLGFELVRNLKSGPKPQSLQWAPTFGGSHMPTRFGILELED